jgi:hypothetical protein
MSKLATFAIAGWLATASAQAVADPDTHRLTISSRDIQGDCGSEGCVPVCSLVAQLQNLMPTNSPEVAIRFYFLGHPGLEEGTETSFGFEFPMMAVGQSEEVRDYVMGMPCATIQARRIVAEIDSTSYLQIEFPGMEAPRLPAQQIIDGASQIHPERG